MPKLTKTNKAVATGSAAVIGCCVAFTPVWEGMDKVARRDMQGTGHPITYCYGQTDEFGKVKVGQRFTKQECDAKIQESFERIYYPGVHACVKRPLPVKTEAALVDAGYNAGVDAACRSRMLQLMNAGDLIGGCNAFVGWRVTGSGQVWPGLIARRGGNPRDARKSEKALCLEGVAEGLPPPAPPPTPQSWWVRLLSPFLKLFGAN